MKPWTAAVTVYLPLALVVMLLGALVTVGALTLAGPPPALRDPLTLSSTPIVLLTCTVRPPAHITNLKHRDPSSRLQVYNTAIRQWAADPAFRVVVVDNSGFQGLARGFPTVEAIAYDERTDPDLRVSQPWFQVQDPNKGAHELAAVRTALRRSMTLRTAHPDTWVIKVTGRFFVPDLHRHLATDQAHQAVAVRQHDPNMCQLLGARLRHMDSLFRGVPHVDMLMETEYRSRLDHDDWARGRVLDLPVLPIPVTLGGGELTPFTHL